MADTLNCESITTYRFRNSGTHRFTLLEFVQGNKSHVVIAIQGPNQHGEDLLSWSKGESRLLSASPGDNLCLYSKEGDNAWGPTGIGPSGNGCSGSGILAEFHGAPETKGFMAKFQIELASGDAKNPNGFDLQTNPAGGPPK